MQFRELKTENNDLRKFQKVNNGQSIIARVKPLEIDSNSSVLFKTFSIEIASGTMQEVGCYANFSYHPTGDLEKLKIMVPNELSGKVDRRVVVYSDAGSIQDEFILDHEQNRYHEVEEDRYVSVNNSKVYRGPATNNELVDMMQSLAEEAESIANKNQAKTL